MREVMSAIGYTPYGEIFATPDGHPFLSAERMWRILQIVYRPDELEELAVCTDRAVVDRMMKRAIIAFNESWRIRLGAPGDGLTSAGEQADVLVSRVLSRNSSTKFSDTPEGSCWFLHQLALDRVDERFLREWMAELQPRIIFNYRDPRDVLLSMVNFLSGKTSGGVGRYADHRIYREILGSVDSIHDRLTIALTDPSFPGSDAFSSALWMLRHPSVCKVAFEDLVGPQGGGSTQRQIRSVSRIIDFVNSDADAEVVAGKVFNRDSFTFYKAQIGGWREHFSPAHERMFADRYGEILELYSYA